MRKNFHFATVQFMFSYKIIYTNKLVVHPQLCNMLLCTKENTGCQGADSNYTVIIRHRNTGNMCLGHLFPRCLSHFSNIFILSGVYASARVRIPIYLTNEVNGRITDFFNQEKEDEHFLNINDLK